MSVVITTLTELTFVDPIAGLVVGIFVAKEAILIIKESANILADRTALDGEKKLQKLLKPAEMLKPAKT